MENTSTSTQTQEKLTRPGISLESLTESNIRHVKSSETEPLIGEKASGILIPYYDIEGAPIEEQSKPFYRLRYDKPPSKDKKYHQVAGSTPHVYVPGKPGDMARKKKNLVGPVDILHLIEGEFKALALYERGEFAVGLNGIWGFCGPEGTIHNELEDIINWLSPQEIWFHGDADTIHKADFAKAACQLAKRADRLIQCPRLDPYGPKGIDDLYDQGEFEVLDLIRIAVGPDQKPLWAFETFIAASVNGYQTDKKELGPGEPDVLPLIQKALASFNKDPDFENSSNRIREYFHVPVTRWTNALRPHIKAAKQAAKELAQKIDEEIDPKMIEASKQIYKVGDKYVWVKPPEEGIKELPLLTIGELRNHMTGAGFPKAFQRRIEVECDLYRKADYVGRICGRPQGVHVDGETTMISTRSPNIIESVPNTKDFREFEQTKFLTKFFKGDLEAFQNFIAWLKIARLALTDYSKPHIGQAIIFAGDASAGKSLTQTFITHCLGGRDCVSAAMFIRGNSNFNEEMWEAEHLILDDVAGDSGNATMRLATDNLKNLIASPRAMVHGKGKRPATLRPIWRITISSNLNTEAKATLPGLDGSTKDKFSVFNVGVAADYMDLYQRGINVLDDVLLKDLGEWLHHVDSFQIPEAMQCPRYGVKAYHDEELAEDMHEGSDSFQFQMHLESYFRDGNKELKGNAGDILGALTSHMPYSARFLRDSRRVGTLIRELKKSESQGNTSPFSITQRRLNGYTIWHVVPRTAED